MKKTKMNKTVSASPIVVQVGVTGSKPHNKNANEVMRCMAVDCSKDGGSGGFWFVVSDVNRKTGIQTMVSRGQVKSRGWLMRKIKQHHPHEVLYDAPRQNPQAVLKQWFGRHAARPWNPKMSARHSNDTVNNRLRSNDL